MSRGLAPRCYPCRRIDKNDAFLDRARARDHRTEYVCVDFAEVRSLNGPFNVILLLSALHYASGPAKLISDLMEMLTSDGVFILECGIAPGAEKKWVSVGRDIDDVVQHPTRAMLMDLFDRASVRTVGLSVHQPGDPVPRQVFHIRHLRPIVLLVSGPSLSGKTTILAALGRASSINPINLDYFLAHMVEWSEQPMLVDLGTRETTDHRLYELVDEMTRAGMEDQFVEEFVDKHARIVTADARPITVIEGFALSRGRFLSAFTAYLRRQGCYVWHVQPAGETDDVRP